MRKRKRARERELRYLSGGVSGGQPVQLEPLIGDNEYHLFLSHTWRHGSGQDAMRVMKNGLLDMVPDLKIFLDVDDLQSGRGAAEVAKSS